MNDKKQIDLRKNYYVDTATISGDYIRITTDNATTVINLKDKAFADIKEININGAKFYKLLEDSVMITKEELKKIIQEEYQNALKDKVVLSYEEIEIRQENYLNGIKYWQDMANKARKQASIEFSERVKSKIIELRRKYHEDCINGLGDEEYNGLTGNNVDEILKEMGVG